MSDLDGMNDGAAGVAKPVLDIDLVVSATAADAAMRAAEHFAAASRAAVQGGGRFAVALSGGTAPEETYRLLGQDPFRSGIDWARVHLFWGDERCVPPGHPRSNFGMAQRAMIRHLPIPAANVHRMPGELPPAEGARRYADELRDFFSGTAPAFDLVHLGVGPDAHTCSLFPFDPLLHERERPVAAALYRPLGEWRITLTLPVVNRARRVEVLAQGAAKAPVVRRALYGPLDPMRLPIQGVRPSSGSMAWLIDEAAARELP